MHRPLTKVPEQHATQLLVRTRREKEREKGGRERERRGIARGQRDGE
jgi:hypothetical protein